MQSEHKLSGYVAKSDQGEAGLGIQLGLKVASGSSAASPSFWTAIVLSVLISLGPCFPKQISSFSLHKMAHQRFFTFQIFQQPPRIESKSKTTL